MTICERLTTIRTDSGKSKAEFANNLNVSPSLITMLENGTRELSKRTAADICEKFNVNPEWLETGKGEPYNDAKTPTLKLLKAEYKLDDLDIQIIEKYLELSPIERQVFKDYIKKIRSAD
ncbi:MAG: helix-turn-helix transcriptional regulator [Ruminococcus bromii]|nr:helix-turn-helix transcriptional regulator [Ruminococcus bromii]